MLFRTINDADKDPATLPAVTTSNGVLIERWFLKVLCGLAAGMGFNNGVVPTQWRDALCGESWPERWGLYVPIPSGVHVLAPEFSLETLNKLVTNEVLAVKFRVAGVHFSLLVGRPDYPSAWGIFHPQSLIFRSGSDEKRIEFVWPHGSGDAITYTKVGTSNNRPPQWDGWKE